MTIITIINYKSRVIVLIYMIWMFPNENPFDKDEASKVWRSRSPKILGLMTRIMILALQSVGFGRVET